MFSKKLCVENKIKLFFVGCDPRQTSRGYLKKVETVNTHLFGLFASIHIRDVQILSHKAGGTTSLKIRLYTCEHKYCQK